MHNQPALDYRVAMPLHILLKSGGLVMNMIMARLILGRCYRWSQIGAVMLLSIGALLATFASAKPSSAANNDADFNEWLIGVLILLASLVLASLLGIYQEQVYRKFGKHWQEGLLYTVTLFPPTIIPLTKLVLNSTCWACRFFYFSKMI
jgi:UDP-xylose/UDP-N-acetylglucosamine transporter B4